MRRIQSMSKRHRRGAVAPLLAAGLFLAPGCAENGRSGDATPTGTSDAPAETNAGAGSNASTGHEAAPRSPIHAPSPRRPAESWTVFRAAFDETADADLICRWTGGNRLEVTTENVRRVTVDLHKLPAGAPQLGPWNLQIDEQGIQITGFRGKVVDLKRSANGVWTVDKDAMPPRR